MDLRVTVVMPVFNGEAYLSEAIESVLCQTFDHFELLIVNDGSTDKTEQIVRGFEAQDSRVRVHTFETNRRWINLNQALADADLADLVARMDCDDICEPHRLERQVQFLEEHPEVDAVGGSVIVVDAASQPSRTVEHPTTPGGVLWSMLFGCAIANPSCMMRRSMIERVKLEDGTVYSPEYTVAEDYHLWLRAIPESRLANLSEVLVRYRRHESNISTEEGAPTRALALGNQACLNTFARIVGRCIDTFTCLNLTFMACDFSEVCSESVSAIRQPQNISSVKSAKCGIQLLQELESSICSLDWLESPEREQVNQDCTARIGELVTHATKLDAAEAQELMLGWIQRGNDAKSLLSNLISFPDLRTK